MHKFIVKGVDSSYLTLDKDITLDYSVSKNGDRVPITKVYHSDVRKLGLNKILNIIGLHLGKDYVTIKVNDSYSMRINALTDMEDVESFYSKRFGKDIHNKNYKLRLVNIDGYRN